MNNKPQYVCPHCGENEFITARNSWDVYATINGKLCWQSNELGQEGFALYCRDCGERAPSNFEDAAK